VITNLLDEACRAAEAAGVPLRAIQKGKDEDGSTHPSVFAADDKPRFATRSHRGARTSARGHRGFGRAKR